MTADPFPLLGERIALRRFQRSDITEDYIGWLNDPVAVRFSNQRFVQHDAVSCERYFQSFAGTPNLFLSVRSRAEDRPIGTMTVYISPQHCTADMGILIGDRTFWGKGFGQDAWKTMLKWLLGPGGMRKVTAGALAVNEPMIRLAERCGMRLECRRMRQEIVEGQEVDILHFGRFADD